MALPSQRLVNDDLFVINRITANDVDTYKVNTDDIGVFLLEADRHPGNQPGDKYVNDGEINIYGKLENLGDDIINLHSANEHCEGKLTFDKGFFITGNAMDVLVSLDYATLTDELTCPDGGLDGSTTCIKLDMVWLSDHIVCGGTGLESNGNCIGINLCEATSGLSFQSSGCLEVNLCPNRAIIFHPVNGCMDVDLNWLTNQLSCDGLRPSGGDVNSSCMEIDMGWLSDNIRCDSTGNPSAYGGSGLIDGGGCIRIDPCWVNDQLNSGNPQYVISDYDATSIDTTNCKLRVNEAWLLQWAKDNIQDIKVAGLCLEISDNTNLFKGDVEITLPEQCMDDWTVGVIQREIKNITVGGCIDISSNQNVALGQVKISTNKSCIEDIIDGHLGVIKKGTGCIGAISNGGDLTKGDVSISVDNDCIQAMIDASLDGFDGTGTIGPTPKDGKLTIKEGTNGIRITATNGKTHSANTAQNTTWTIDMDPDSCPDFNEPISATRLHLKESGGGGEPAIVIGTEKAFKGGCIAGPDGKPEYEDDGVTCKHGIKAWLGINSNQQNGSFSCVRGIEGWKDIEDCGGSAKGETERLFSVAAGTRVKPHHATAGLIELGTGEAEDVRVFLYGDDSETGIVGGKPEERKYNRFCFARTKFFRGQIEEISRSNDARINFNIDDIIDTFGGYNDDPEVTDGIFRWGLKPMSEYGDHKYPYLFIDSKELAQKLPGFVDYTPGPSAWEVFEMRDDDGELIDTDFVLKDDFDPSTQTEPGAINWQAVHAVAIAALAKHKRRIAELEAKTTRAGTLNTLGIVEYTNETAAANSGLGQGEVYWDTTLNRMRAVT